MNPGRLLQRISRGSVQNVAFGDFRRLAEALGFRLSRVSGSHHVFVHPRAPVLLNIQDYRGEAKPYQIRQFLRIVERYNLSMEGDA
jgi:hypothetical protein